MEQAHANCRILASFCLLIGGNKGEGQDFLGTPNFGSLGAVLLAERVLCQAGELRNQWPTALMVL